MTLKQWDRGKIVRVVLEGTGGLGFLYSGLEDSGVPYSGDDAEIRDQKLYDIYNGKPRSRLFAWGKVGLGAILIGLGVYDAFQ